MTAVAPAPLIVTALFGAADFAWLDGLRRQHYPAERNLVPAHCTLFHHLPPAVGPELKQRLAAAARRQAAPVARLGGWRDLGKGVAFRIESAGLEAIRADLADAFAPLLMPQDRAGWRPHVTIQNKAERSAVRALIDELEASFAPRPLKLAGLGAGTIAAVHGSRIRGICSLDRLHRRTYVARSPERAALVGRSSSAG